MLKTVEKLIKADRDTTLGNHRLHIDSDGTEYYYYHATCICKVNHSERTFTIDDGGWKTSSTSRAIHDYRFYFKSLGYFEIDTRK